MKKLLATAALTALAFAATPAQAYELPNYFTPNDGCPEGKNRVYVNEPSGLFGLGSKKVSIGCMTQDEQNRYNYEMRQQWANSQPVYQPRPPINCTTYGDATTCY